MTSHDQDDGRKFAPSMGVNVRIVRQPYGFVNGISLRRYQPGHTYEMHPALGEYLVLEGFAEFEMRRGQRSSRARPNERRKDR